MREEEQLYRQKAIEEHSTLYENYQLITIIDERAWLWLGAMFVLVMVGVLWLFLGTVSTRVSGTGVLLEKNGSLNSVAIGEKGRYVTDLRVTLGQTVKKGQILAEIKNLELENQIIALKNHVKLLQTEYQILKENSKRVLQKREEEVAKKIEILARIIRHEGRKQQQLKRILISKREGVKTGIISRENLVDTELEYSLLFQNLLRDKKERVDVIADLNTYQDEWSDRLMDFKLKLDEQNSRLETLKGFQILHATLVSPLAGVVSFIQTKRGDYVNPGQSLFFISTSPKDLLAEVYVDAREGKMITKGMSVAVMPTITKTLEYGAIQGVVSRVADYPETSDSMLALHKNKNLAQHFLQDKPVIALQVRLLKDKRNISGFAWTSSRGPHFHFSSGTLLTASIITRKEHPVQLILPRIKNWVDYD